MAYFPFFVDIKNKDCLVVGSGSVALRKIEQLLSFEACVTCISPGNIEIDAVNFINREFKDSDLDNRFIVIACSDNHSLNKHIGRLCREKGIAVNVVDDKEECSFIFPSIIKNGDITAAFSSNGNNPVICKYLKERISPPLNKSGLCTSSNSDCQMTNRHIILGQFSLNRL